MQILFLLTIFELKFHFFLFTKRRTDLYSFTNEKHLFVYRFDRVYLVLNKIQKLFTHTKYVLISLFHGKQFRFSHSPLLSSVDLSFQHSVRKSFFREPVIVDVWRLFGWACPLQSHVLSSSKKVSKLQVTFVDPRCRSS